MHIKRIVVTGGREFNDIDRVREDLRIVDPVRVAQGGARGADQIARDAWWSLTGCIPRLPASTEDRSVTYLADWSKHGRSAGLRRNEEMLDAEKPDLVLAYPDPASRGTWHCIKAAIRMRVPVVVWAPFVGPAMLLEHLGAMATKAVIGGGPRWYLAPPTAIDAIPRPSVADMAALFGG